MNRKIIVWTVCIALLLGLALGVEYLAYVQNGTETVRVTSVAIPYTGNMLGYDSQLATVTVGDITYKDLNHWSTNIQYSGKKILLVGNSFSLRLGEELHRMAQANGEELFVANLYYGGCNVEQHWTWLPSCSWLPMRRLRICTAKTTQNKKFHKIPERCCLAALLRFFCVFLAIKGLRTFVRV